MGIQIYTSAYGFIAPRICGARDRGLKDGFVSDWIWIAVIGLLAYEVWEHLILPLLFAVVNRNKPSPSGPQGMVGKMCVVREWEKGRGKVMFNSELWNAVGEGPISPNRRVVIRKVEGLTLVVEPPNEQVS